MTGITDVAPPTSLQVFVAVVISNQKSNQNQIKIYIAPYVHEDSEALGGWITCSRRVGIDEFLNAF